MARDKHYKAQLAQALDTIAGLTVVTTGNRQQQHARPSVRVVFAGMQRNAVSEAQGAKLLQLLYDLEVSVASDDTNSVEDERDRLTSAIEYTIETTRLTPYSGADFRTEFFTAEVTSASPLLDEDQRHASFFVTVVVHIGQFTVS